MLSDHQDQQNDKTDNRSQGEEGEERGAEGEASLFLTSWAGPVVVLGYGQDVGGVDLDPVEAGRLRSIEKGRPRNVEDAGAKTDDVYYQFVMELTDITTGEVIWADQKEIRKTKKTSLFGK